jgi:uncharacterized MAPEG superfamily protein
MTDSQAPNYSFHYIAGAYAFSLIPHQYYVIKAMTAKDSTYTNITPRTNLDTLKATAPPDTWTKLVKARGCHLNALEGFPLFAAAMIAGNVAGVSTKEMNVLGAEYLGVRLLYNVLYMAVRNEPMSYLRSGVYVWSVGIPIYLLIKAGGKLNA